MTTHDERQDHDDERWDGHPLAPASVVRWPASAMWGFGLLQLILTQTWIAFLAAIMLVDVVDNGRTLADVWKLVRKVPLLWLTLIGWPFATIGTILVMRGANELRRFGRYGLAITAAVLTMFAVPVVFLAVIQLPLGVWVLVLLARRDVRARFEAVARGTITPVPPEAPDARADQPA
jgi:hypothetical protein